MSIVVEMTKEFRFEAAHYLPNVPEHHQCRSLHGHSYTVILKAAGPIDEKMGWVMDLSELSERFSPLLKILDHSLLNEIEGLANPTGENVAVWIFTRLEKDLPQLTSVTVEATNRIAITVTRSSFR